MKKLLIASVAAAFCVLSQAAVASEPAKPAASDFGTEITDLNGEVMKGPNGKPITIGSAIEQALLSQVPADPGNPKDTMAARFLLARDMHEQKDYHFSSDEIVLVKYVVTKAWPTALVYGRVIDQVAPADLKKP